MQQHRRERQQWVVGTALMAVVPLHFAVSALLHPAPLDPGLAEAIRSAILTPPAWMTQIVGPIDLALRHSGLQVLPAIVVLLFLLRMWFGYGRQLFKSARASQGATPPSR
jgi:hypothetical protein